MNLNEHPRREANVTGPATQSTAPIAPSVPTVRVWVASATGMRANLVLDLAEEHDIAMILDNRRDPENDAALYPTTTLARLLGPCYARLPGDPRVSGLCIGEITGMGSLWRGRSSILVLADADQIEPLIALARTACEPHVTVELVPIPALLKEAVDNPSRR